MFPEVGEKLGPYEILDELRGGERARVYRGWDSQLQREVAIKVIVDHSATPEIGERAVQEARAASALNHPNICTIFDTGQQNGSAFLVMELLEGETLRERMKRVQLSVEEILGYSSEVADALTAAHARGIVHRDVTADSIFLVRRPNGTHQVKMLDFGLAMTEQSLSEQREVASNLTSIAATVETASYMSPEQARGEKLDARSDLFSLGIVMYEMATGQLPFRGNTSPLVFVQLLGQMDPEPIRQQNALISAELEELITKLLARNPRARFQSSTELTDKLHELAERESGWLTRLTTASPMEDARPVPVKRFFQPLETPPSQSNGAERRGQETQLEEPSSGPAADELSAPLYLSGGGVQPQRTIASEEIEAADDAGGRLSERPMRTSIAANARMSYPSVAPYMGQLNTKPSARTSSPRGLANSVGVTSQENGEDVSASGSWIEPVHRESSAPIDGEGIGWRPIALLLVILLLLAGLVAWKFGFLGVAAPLRSGVMPFAPQSVPT